MSYNTDHTRFDPFNFRRYEAEVAQGLPAGLAKILYVLGGRMSWCRDNERFPFGTISGLSVKKLAELCQMSLSTVQAHLAEAKRRGILAAVMLYDDAGSCLGLRYQYPGFVSWLLEGRHLSRSLDATDEEGVQPAGGGGYEQLDPLKIRSSDKIIDDGILNLEFEGSVKFTEVADAIREAKPLVEGQPADPDKVWTDFRAFNRKKGYHRLALKWLVGFCRVYGRRRKAEPVSATATAPEKSAGTTSQDTNTAITQPMQPVFATNTPLDQVGRHVCETKGQGVWLSWIKPLHAKLCGDRWVINAPSAFHSSYVKREFEAVFERVFGVNAFQFAQG